MEDIKLKRGFRVVFGLEAQGHIPLIEEKIYSWYPLLTDENKFQVWEDIAKEIGWSGYAVCQGYIEYLQRKNKELMSQLTTQDK